MNIDIRWVEYAGAPRYGAIQVGTGTPTVWRSLQVRFADGDGWSEWRDVPVCFEKPKEP